LIERVGSSSPYLLALSGNLVGEQRSKGRKAGHTHGAFPSTISKYGDDVAF